MKMKSQLAVATLLFAGLLASGCSQQQAAGGDSAAAQQTAAPAEKAPAAAPAPAAKAPVVPKVKAKGNYKGPVKQSAADAAAMEQHKK